MVIVRFASHPLAANADLDPMSLPAYDAVARHLMADKGSRNDDETSTRCRSGSDLRCRRRFRSGSFVIVSARKQPAVLAEPRAEERSKDGSLFVASRLNGGILQLEPQRRCLRALQR